MSPAVVNALHQLRDLLYASARRPDESSNTMNCARCGGHFSIRSQKRGIEACLWRSLYTFWRFVVAQIQKERVDAAKPLVAA